MSLKAENMSTQSTMDRDDVVVSPFFNEMETMELSSRQSTISTSTCSSVTTPFNIDEEIPTEITVEREPAPFAQLCINQKEKSVMALIVRRTDVLEYISIDYENQSFHHHHPLILKMSSSLSSFDAYPAGSKLSYSDYSTTTDSSSGIQDTVAGPQDIVWLDACWLLGTSTSEGSENTLHHTLLPDSQLSSEPSDGFAYGCSFFLCPVYVRNSNSKDPHSRQVARMITKLPWKNNAKQNSIAANRNKVNYSVLKE